MIYERFINLLNKFAKQERLTADDLKVTHHKEFDDITQNNVAEKLWELYKNTNLHLYLKGKYREESSMFKTVRNLLEIIITHLPKHKNQYLITIACELFTESSDSTQTDLKKWLTGRMPDDTIDIVSIFMCIIKSGDLLTRKNSEPFLQQIIKNPNVIAYLKNDNSISRDDFYTLLKSSVTHNRTKLGAILANYITDNKMLHELSNQNEAISNPKENQSVECRLLVKKLPSNGVIRDKFTYKKVTNPVTDVNIDDRCTANNSTSNLLRVLGKRTRDEEHGPLKIANSGVNYPYETTHAPVDDGEVFTPSEVAQLFEELNPKIDDEFLSANEINLATETTELNLPPEDLARLTLR